MSPGLNRAPGLPPGSWCPCAGFQPHRNTGWPPTRVRTRRRAWKGRFPWNRAAGRQVTSRDPAAAAVALLEGAAVKCCFAPGDVSVRPPVRPLSLFRAVRGARAGPRGVPAPHANVLVHFHPNRLHPVNRSPWTEDGWMDLGSSGPPNKMYLDGQPMLLHGHALTPPPAPLLSRDIHVHDHAISSRVLLDRRRDVLAHTHDPCRMDTAQRPGEQGDPSRHPWTPGHPMPTTSQKSRRQPNR